MRYTFVPLRVRDALAARRWRYPGEYAIYDFSAAELLATALLQRVLLATIYFSALDERGELAGIFTLTPSSSSVEIGVAMRPDLTGRGLGLRFMEAGLDFAHQRFHPRRFTLDVAAFNERARTVYERAGFHEVRRFRRATRGKLLEYIAMERTA
jgi:[ribosomal protein S18]-alanine N-acetyltransferase